MKRLLAILALLAVDSSLIAPTLTVTPENPVAPAKPNITWDMGANATNCVASGTANWTGNKANKGTEVGTVGRPAGDLTFVLTCDVPSGAKGTAKLTWSAPMQNEDGTSLTNLAGYKVIYGTNSTALDKVITLNNASAVTFVVENLDPATWFFTLRAFNSTGAESKRSNVVSKTITGGTTKLVKTTVWKVLPAPSIPKPPGGLTVVDETAWNVAIERTDGRVYFVLNQKIGAVAEGASCFRDFRVPGTDYYRIARTDVTYQVNDPTLLVVARCKAESIS